MNHTAVSVTEVGGIDHDEAMALAATEYNRFAALVESLSGVEWSAPTDCTEWIVRDVVLHVLGTAEGSASSEENEHQMRAARQWAEANGRPFVDGLGAVQISERSDLVDAEIPARVRRVFPDALNGRTNLPVAVREKLTIDVEIPGISETWKLGYLTDLILTRDVWMHRVDISRATGRALELTAGHDGRLVADIVAEWARRHGHPFTLELRGSAGGTFVLGEASDRDGEVIPVDAVEFCRIVSGRAPGAGLLTQEVAF
jgi:uncharacterized protein (TIGR03083 family)